MNPYFASILQGSVLTIGVSLSALLVAMVLGLLGALAKLSTHRLARGVATAYTTLVRGVPELVLMLLLFYGGTIGVNRLFEWSGSDLTVDINPFAAGVFTLGFIYGAFMTETFRGAMLCIPKGQAEAARAYGMRPGQIVWRITLPQMLRHALPGITNNWLVLIKATALVSLIGLHEMTYLAKQASSATRSPFMFLFFTAMLFLIYTSASLGLLNMLHRRYSLGVRRAGT